MSFPAGHTVVRRNVFRGQVWSAWPLRVVSDTADSLVAALWPGTTVVSQRSPRDQHLVEVAAGVHELGPSTIEGSTILGFQLPDRWFSVLLFWGRDGFRYWYVNFERPFRRTSIGLDTWDLMLDLVIAPDGTHRWKDEDEYAHGRRLGIASDGDHAAIEVARAEALAMFERRVGPFEERWLDWRVDPVWPVPTLPADALDLTAADV